MKYLTIFSSFILLIALCHTSCDKGGDDDENNPADNPDTNQVSGVLKLLDIVDARYLLIAGQGQQKSADSISEMNTLFKVTDDGVIMEVSYLNEDSVQITLEKEPYEIFDVNEIYMIIVFATPGNSFEMESYLVRKTDGAVYVSPGTPFGEVQTDKYGNIYFLTHIGLVKINTDNPENLTAEELVSSTIEDVQEFIVDTEGNILYNGKIRFTNGGFDYLDHTTSFDSRFWLAFDEKFYYTYKGGAFNVNTFCNDITINNNIAEETFLDSIDYINVALGPFVISSQVHGVIKLPGVNKILIFGNYILEVYNDEMHIKCHDLSVYSEVAVVDKVLWSDNYYYFLGKNSTNQPLLVKTDPSGFPHIETRLLEPNQYDIYEITVSNDNEILFNALRMADGKRIIGKIDSDGNIVALDEEVDTPIMQLIRVQ